MAGYLEGKLFVSQDGLQGNYLLCVQRIGYPNFVEELCHGSLRLSLCEWNTQEDVDHILKEVPRIVAYLRSISPVWKDLASGKKQFML